MKRRDFLKSVTGAAAGAMVPAPAIWSAAKADARSETLLIVSEGGPNNLDIHGIGYTEINVDANPAASAELVRHVGKRAIPQLVIDGEWFQPYDPGRGLLYDELHKRLGIPHP